MDNAGIVKFSAGDKVGRWTVLGDVQTVHRKSGKSEQKILCRCDCGTERYVLERSLLYGASQSCGCLRKEKAAEAISYDLSGKAFGDLRVLYETEPRNSMKGRWWVCQCSCGNTYACPGSLLVTGKRTHCGCKMTKNYYSVDISGQKFQYLTALYPTKQRTAKGGVIWHCQCDCGNEVDVPYNNLVFCKQKSCGYQKKEHDKKLGTFLTHVAGTSVDMLKSKKIPTDNTTGYKGVYLIKGKYVAKIVFQKKAYYLGTYDDIVDAAEARKEAEEILFDGVAEHYAQWKQMADTDPSWAEENPIQIFVTQNSDKRLSLTLLPALNQAGYWKG